MPSSCVKVGVVEVSGGGWWRVVAAAVGLSRVVVTGWLSKGGCHGGCCHGGWLPPVIVKGTGGWLIAVPLVALHVRLEVLLQTAVVCELLLARVAEQRLSRHRPGRRALHDSARQHGRHRSGGHRRTAAWVARYVGRGSGAGQHRRPANRRISEGILRKLARGVPSEAW